jgi:RNA 3'-terminal phosphate cyclase-like protein
VHFPKNTSFSPLIHHTENKVHSRWLFLWREALDKLGVSWNNHSIQMATLKFQDGAVQFRQRLAVSLLSHRPVLIRNIRSDDLEAPGLREHEASFLRLLDRLTNGTVVEINATGTQLRFKPGLLLGGNVQHDCPTSRSVGWFLEGILPLAAFGKEPLHLTLSGVTDGTANIDPSPDYLRASIIPLLSQFGIESDDGQPAPYIKVIRRGAATGGGGGGGGMVEMYVPLVKELKPIDLTEMGKVKRVRGTAISLKLAPTSTARVAHACKGVLHRLLPDVWIHTDSHSSKRHGGCGPSPALSLLLTAESTTGVHLTAECCLDPSQPRGKELPEDLGVRGATMLLEEIRRGGCVDTSAQSLVLLLMCLGPEDVARIRIGTLSQYTIVSLRLFKEAFDVEFKVRPDNDTKTVLLSCLGTGFRNMARAST